jgi:hypothetical protein
MSTQKTNLILDSIAFAGFLVIFEPRLTGIALHEWLALALAGTLVVHILLHWKWVASVTVQFFKKLFHESRLHYILDLALLVSFVTMFLSGFLISRSVLPFFNLQPLHDRSWTLLHASSALLSLLLMGLHLAMNWKWIASTVKRYVFSPVAELFHRPQPSIVNLQPAVVSVPVDRSEDSHTH